MSLKKIIFACVDCETTGLDPKQDRIIEIGAVLFSLEQTRDTFSSLINPECPISESSIQIHNISQDLLVTQPTIDQVLPSLFQLIGSSVIVGHSIQFDLDILRASAERCHMAYPLEKNLVIDTLRLARLYGDSPNNSLGTLAKHFNIEHQEVHRALPDALINVAVFSHLVVKFHTLEEIKKVLEKPIRMKYMPLGKYKGRSFSEIPLNYLRWAAKMDFDQDLSFSIRSELKLRKNHSSFQQSTNPFLHL